MTCRILLIHFDNRKIFAGCDIGAVHIFHCCSDGEADGAGENTHRIEIRRPRPVFSALYRTPSERIEASTVQIDFMFVSLISSASTSAG